MGTNPEYQKQTKEKTMNNKVNPVHMLLNLLSLQMTMESECRQALDKLVHG